MRGGRREGGVGARVRESREGGGDDVRAREGWRAVVAGGVGVVAADVDGDGDARVGASERGDGTGGDGARRLGAGRRAHGRGVGGARARHGEERLAVTKHRGVGGCRARGRRRAHERGERGCRVGGGGVVQREPSEALVRHRAAGRRGRTERGANLADRALLVAEAALHEEAGTVVRGRHVERALRGVEQRLVRYPASPRGPEDRLRHRSRS